MKIILASQSSRRKELLSLMGVDFETIIPEKDEDMKQKVSITKLSEILSHQKAREVFEKTSGERLIIGSDCMVFLAGKKFGKPKSRDEAFKMLSSLSNKWHKVVTGLSVVVEDKNGYREYLTHSVSKVRFKNLTDDAINAYLDTGEYKDKAGAYAIQGKSGMFISKVHGNFASIMGLPTSELYDILKTENILK